MKTDSKTITLRSLVFGTLVACVFAIITVYFSNRQSMQVTANQIAVLPYMLLILMVLVLNPLCRLLRVVRTFSMVEIMIIFIMGTVSSGLSTFGLSSQLVPIVGSLFNREWNTSQSEWNRYVVPFMNEKYFVSEAGVQAAADRYRQALEAALADQSVYDTALMNQQARAKLAEAEAAARQAETAAGTDPDKADQAAAARLALENARKAHQQVQAQWDALNAVHPPGSVEDVLKTYPRKIEDGERRVEQTKEELDAIEAGAFEKVQIFRRGLPRGLRAYPGIIPMSDDNFHSYGRRLKRMLCGRAAMHELEQAQTILAGRADAEPLDNAAADLLDRRLAAAGEALAPVAQTGMYRERQAEWSAKEAQTLEKIAELDRRLGQLSAQRRQADREAGRPADKQLATVARELKHWNTIRDDTAKDRDRNDRQLAITEKVAGLSARLEEFRAALRPTMTAAEARSALAAAMQEFPAIEGSLRQWLVGDVPWTHWLQPLLRWSIVIAMSYVILMSLNLLIFRQWAHNEKLTYPLVELPKALLSEDGIPPMFRSPIFWLGLALSGLALGWNVLCKTNIVPGLSQLDFNNYWHDYVVNTPFDALKYSGCPIFFTMIGLAFLVPKNVSFSLWFFFVIGLVELQLMVWTGHGVDAKSFQSDWWYLAYFVPAQGQGALLVFSSVVLFKCRKYILCAFRPGTVGELEPGERKELKAASFLFLFCSLGLILILWRDMGANLYYTLFFYLAVIVITIGLVRAVTEGGLLSFQCNGGPFHFIRAVFGLDKTWTSTSLFAPLMVYYAMLLLDIKTFIAPAMANSLKLRSDFKMKRGAFHAAIFLALAIAGVTGVSTAIMMCYSGGADIMQGWFYTSLPRNAMFDVVRSMTKDAPTASPALSLWIASGAAAMAALLYFRQFIFWLPHPLGLVMFVNPIMSQFWFSILLGWLANVMLTKFGNKETFQKAKGFFIGLIVGELTVVVASMIISLIMGFNVTITLNR